MSDQDTQDLGDGFVDRPLPGERLGRFWRMSGRRVLLVVLVAATMAVVAGLITSRQPTEYVSSTTLVVQDETGSADSETLIRSMQTLLTSEDLGGEVQELTDVDLTPQQIAAEISVERAPGSGVLRVSVTDTDRERSRVIAEAIVPAFTTLVDELIRPDQEESPATFSVTRWGTGEVLTQEQPPPATRNAVLGFGLGLILAVAAVLLLQQQRPTIGSAVDARDAFGLPLLAVVPRIRSRRLTWNPSDMTEGVLRAGVSVGWPTRPASIAVYGPGGGDERSGFIVALAWSLVADGADVTIIDANVNHAGVTALLDAGDRPGLLDYASGSAPLGECVHNVRPGSGPAWATDVAVSSSAGELFLVPRGVTDVESLAVVGGDAGERLVGVAAERSVVLVDLPPIPGPVPVSRLLNSCDSVIAVATEFRTLVSDVFAAGEALRTLGDRPAGVVLLGGNRLQMGRPRRDRFPDARPTADKDRAAPQSARKRPVRRGDRRPEPPSSAARDLRPRAEGRP
ncbi:MAG: hypothetical protein R3A49_08380 [Acidimicrobiia bacterium]